MSQVEELYTEHSSASDVDDTPALVVTGFGVVVAGVVKS